MKITGTITFIGAEETVGQNALRKRSFVVEEASDKERKSSLCIDCIKDKVSLLDGLSVGDAVEVSINYKANEYNGKRYNSITARRIDNVGGESVEGLPEADQLPF